MHDPHFAFDVRGEALRRLPLFHELPAGVLEALVAEVRRARAEPGQLVVTEGSPADEMFVVIGGELEVVKRGDSGTDVRVAMFGPGDWFGEMAVLGMEPRSATVRAVSPTIMLAMRAEHIERAVRARDPGAYGLLMRNIARELSRRLRVADGILAHFVASVADAFGQKP